MFEAISQREQKFSHNKDLEKRNNSESYENESMDE
jgi:hypothetical protein